MLISCIVLAGFTSSRQIFAGTQYLDCYDIPGYPTPVLKANKVLYVLVDQTMKLTPAMQQSVIDLVSEWGRDGENVKISRFSANIKGQYTELVFDEIGNIPPTQDFLFHLRRKEKRTFLDCIKKRKNAFNEKMTTALIKLLKITDDKLPKTNLLHSLRDFARQMISIDKTADKTVLIVSDGLENSDVFSFHKRGVIRKISSKRSMQTVRKNKLIPDWQKAKVYFMGIGYISDAKFYARPRIVAPLKSFWYQYFTEGNAILHNNSLGTPMLLTKSILQAAQQ